MKFDNIVNLLLTTVITVKAASLSGTKTIPISSETKSTSTPTPTGTKILPIGNCISYTEAGNDCLTNSGIYFYDDKSKECVNKNDVCFLPSKKYGQLPNGDIEMLPENNDCITDEDGTVYCGCLVTDGDNDNNNASSCLELIENMTKYVPTATIEKKPLETTVIPITIDRSVEYYDYIKLPSPVYVRDTAYNYISGTYSSCFGRKCKAEEITQEKVDIYKHLHTGDYERYYKRGLSASVLTTTAPPSKTETLTTKAISSKVSKTSSISTTKTGTVNLPPKNVTPRCSSRDPVFDYYTLRGNCKYVGGILINKNEGGPCVISNNHLCLIPGQFKKYLVDDSNYCYKFSNKKFFYESDIWFSTDRCNEKGGIIYYLINDQCHFNDVCLKSKTNGEIKFDDDTEILYYNNLINGCEDSKRDRDSCLEVASKRLKKFDYKSIKEIEIKDRMKIGNDPKVLPIKRYHHHYY